MSDETKWSCDHCGRVEDGKRGWIFSPEHGDYAACPDCVERLRLSTPSDYVRISKPRLERLIRVVLLAKEADRLERHASLMPVGITDDIMRLIAMARANGARIAMGTALDALELGDTTL